MKWLGHEIDEEGIKPNKEKVKAILDLKHPENPKQLKSFLGAIQYLAKFLPRLSERTDKLRKLLKKNTEWKWETEQQNDFEMIKKNAHRRTTISTLRKRQRQHCINRRKQNRLGITLWQKQADGELKPIAFGSRFLNDSEKNYSIGELELLAVVWGLEKFRFYLYGKKVFLYTGHQALEPLIKRNRCNKQYSARLTRWLDRLAHFDISIQHIAGSNLKFTDYLSRNPVEGATTENTYDEQYVINTLTEQGELNLKYGRVFTNQLQHAPNAKITHDCELSGQSETNRTFEKNRHVNKTNERTETSPNSDAIEFKRQETLPLHNHLKPATASIEKEMDHDYFHWGATAEIMQIIQRREKSPETRRLVERRLEIARPGTMRRRYEQNAQRTIFVPSRPNKRSREEIAEIDGQLIQRANRLGGGYQPLQTIREEQEQIPMEEQLPEEQSNDPESEGESQIIRGDNLPIVDLKNYNTEGKEAHYVQINQIIGVVTEGKKVTEETIKKAEMDFMLDLKSLIAKSATDAELNRVKLSLTREDRSMAPEHYRQQFGNISTRWGLTFINDKIIVPTELRKKLLNTLHFGHAGTTKMAAEAKIFWWPNITKDIEEKVKNCVACLSSGKNLKYQLPKNESGKLRTLTEPGQEIQIDFTGKLHNKKLNGENQLLIAVDRFSKWPTVKICKTSETKEVINFLKQNFNLYGIPEKIKSDKGGAFISKKYIEFCKSKNIEIEYSTPRIHTGTGAVERAIQTMKNLIVANLEDNLCLTECVNRALKVMRFTIHTGLKLTPFELHHGRKPRTELTNLVKNGKSFLSDWTELSVSAERKPKIPIYASRDEEGDVTNYLVMAKTKAEEKAVDKQPKKKHSVSEYPFKFVEKTTIENH